MRLQQQLVQEAPQPSPPLRSEAYIYREESKYDLRSFFFFFLMDAGAPRLPACIFFFPRFVFCLFHHASPLL